MKKFSLDNSKHDLSTYYGRYLYFLELTDPRFLFYSTKQIHDAKSILDNYKKSGKICESNKFMWHQRRIYESSVHSYTGDIINPLFRVAAIAPVNIPLVFGMVTIPSTNVPGTLMMHFLNQSYNFACNYANRPGEALSTNAMISSYILAVTSACGAAYGLGKITAFRRFGAVIPLISSGIANVSNIAVTRSSELKEGANICDNQGNILGKSVVAGQIGIAQTCLTRGILVPMACFMLPPIGVQILKLLKVFPSNNKRLAMITELFIIYASLQAALPAALAIFPQQFEIPRNELEMDLQKQLEAKHRTVYANKGL